MVTEVAYSTSVVCDMSIPLVTKEKEHWPINEQFWTVFFFKQKWILFDLSHLHITSSQM